MRLTFAWQFFGGFLIAGLLCTFSICASADDAKEKYLEGVSLFEKKEFKDAAAAFRAAYKMKPSWKVLYNVAQSEAAAKRHGLALEAFEAYLSEGGDDVPDTRRDEVLTEVERLRKMVGSIEVTAPEGAVIFVDGVNRGTAPLLGRLPVAASIKHVVWAESKGKKFARRPFKVMGNSSFKIDLKHKEDPVVAVVVTPKKVPEKTPEKEPDPPPGEPMVEETIVAAPAAEEDDTKSGTNLSTIGWLSIGVGVVMATTGGITGGLALNIDGDLNENCEKENNENCKQGDIDKLKALALTSDLLLFTGGAVAATGLILLIVDKSRSNNEEASSLSFAPAISPGFTGAVIKGRF